MPNASDELAISEGCYLDEAAADRVRTFFARFLRHSKGQFAGKPFVLLDWQWNNVILPLFGWKRKDGTRRFRKAYIEIPKKQGKSALCSAIALYLLMADGEAGAEVYCGAADRDQAGIVYNEAANMVEASPALSGKLDLVRSVKRIVYPATKSWFKALSADVPTKEGLNIHGLIFDELHAQQKRDLWDTLAYGGAARRQPLFISITTAGYDRDSICWEQHEYATNVLSGQIVDTAFFAFIAAADEEDDWKSPETWKKANPSLGVTVMESEMAEACKEAQNSPAKENAFRRYRLNQWTRQDVRAIPMDAWNVCGEIEVDPQELQGVPCFGGLDLASTQDVNSFVLVFPVEQSYKVLSWFWVPEECAKDRERRNKTRFDRWIHSGLMEATPGNVTDYGFIRRKINELSKLYDVQKIAFDPWNATQLAIQLTEEDGLPMVQFRQGFVSMNEPTKELLGLIASNRLHHGDNPVLNWMAGNFVVKTDPAGNLKPAKDKATEKIDGIVATIMALGLAITSPIEPVSIYETRRDFLTFGGDDTDD